MRAAAVAVALILGVGVPWAGIAMLVPSLETSERALVTNYRGRRVFYGLGLVWLVWAISATLGGFAPSLLWGQSALSVLLIAGPLALVAFTLGVVDDAYGTSDARGFKGHIKALLAGRLTTGGLKLFGVSLAGLAAGVALIPLAPWRPEVDGPSLASGVAGWALALVAGASIALTSNFVNLTDLRPGRALKVYSVLAVMGALSTALLFGGDGGIFTFTTGEKLIDLAALLLFVLGPVFAVWRHDLGERGMLGDAGANPMGAVAGLLIVAGLPRWGLLAYFVAIFALNLASEKVSFSTVIAASPLLSRLDGWGRLAPDDTSSAADETCPPTNANPE